MDLATLDLVDAPVVVLDRDGKIVAWNLACVRLTGRAGAGVVGRPLRDLVLPIDAASVERALAGWPPSAPAPFEAGLVPGGKAGKLRWTSAVERDADGTIERLWLTGAEAPLARAERAEEAWRALFEQASDGIFVADLDGRYTDVNEAGCRMLGATRDDIVGKTILDLIPPEDVPRLAQSREDMIRGGVDVAEWRLRRMDGSWVPVEVSAKILPDGRWQGFVRDITERLRAAEALAASEEKFRTILSIATDAVISCDQEQRIVLFNQGAERIFGWKEAEILGQSLDVLIPGSVRELHRVYVETFAESGVAAKDMADRQLVRALRRDGREFAAQAGISQVPTAGGRVFTVVLRDMTEVVRRYEEERFLAEAASVLARSLDVGVTLAELARVAVTWLADVCIVEVVREHGIERLRVEARDASLARVAEALQREPIDRRRPHLFSKVLASHQPELLADLDEAYLDRTAQTPARRRLFAELRPKSALVLPLVARGHLRGAIALVSTDRRYEDRDLRVGMQLADRAAVALDNARLHETLAATNEDLRATVRELEEAQTRIRTLTGLLPTCAWCGRIREANGEWTSLEQYVVDHTAAEFTHGICPECAAKQLPP